MSDNKLVVKKVIELPIGWRDDVDSLVNYSKESVKVSLAISQFLLDGALELESLSQEITIVLTAKEEGSEKELDTDFWISVANGEYNE